MAGQRRWQGQKLWEPLGEYEAMEHIAGLSQSGMSLSAYAKARGVNRNALAEAVKRDAPELYERITADNPSEGKAKSGRSFEAAAKGMLQRRGYYVIRTYGSKSPIDMLAVGLDKPTLFVQAKKDGKLYFGEWNAVFDLATLYGGWPVLVQRPPDGSKGALWFRLLGRKAQKGMRNDGMLLPFEPRDPSQASLLAPATAV